MKQFHLIIIAGICACSFPIVAEASFVAFWNCEKDAANLGHPDRELKALDCLLALSKEIKDSVPGLSYMPTIDPNEVFLVKLGSNVFTQMLLLDPADGYIFGAGTDFNSLLSSNSFSGATDISNIGITALSIDIFAGFAEAANEAEALGDLSVAFENSLWNSEGMSIFSGASSTFELNTTGLSVGQYILRTQISDSVNGDPIYGLGFLQVVSEPSTLALLGIATLGLLLPTKRRYQTTI